MNPQFQQMTERQVLQHKIQTLCGLGISLSTEHDNNKLLEDILVGIKAMTNADAGTLYLMTEEKKLAFSVVRTSSLDIAMGGTTGVPVTFDAIPLYDQHGRPNDKAVVAHSALHNKTVNIPDAYNTSYNFDFSGPRAFDRRTGYRSRSFLTIPMRNHENDIIGVLQFINAQNPDNGQVIPFSTEDQQLAESLASQAAIALTNKRLVDEMRELFESFVRLIATAIDQKSPYTGEHCRRVPELTMMFAESAEQAEFGPLRNFRLLAKDRYALHVASWLHDCGKITTPDHLMDKATKLEAIFDRIKLVDLRCELLRKDAEIALLRRQLAAAKARIEPKGDLQQEFADFCRLLDDERLFLHKSNIGAEFMLPEDQERVRRIGSRLWNDSQHGEQPLLTDEEIYNLQIYRGTLTAEDREVVNYHIVATIDMLNSLPFPKNLRNVPEYAGGHHERMDGRGYPKGLTREELSVPARIMAIADIFEALTARDRPYKKAKTLSESLHILGKMKEDQHIDPDLFDLFVRDKVYLRYAQQFLEPEQIDDVDESRIPGYNQ